jgi:hypothetical protein
VHVWLAQFGAGASSRSTIDDVLYNSEDSYTALRSLYLQNRRFELRGGQGDGCFDPYADEAAASDPANDAYSIRTRTPISTPTASDPTGGPGSGDSTGYDRTGQT